MDHLASGSGFHGISGAHFWNHCTASFRNSKDNLHLKLAILSEVFRCAVKI